MSFYSNFHWYLGTAFSIVTFILVFFGSISTIEIIILIGVGGIHLGIGTIIHNQEATSK